MKKSEKLEKIYCQSCTKYTGYTLKSILKENKGYEKNILCKNCGRVFCKIKGKMKKPIIMKTVSKHINNNDVLIKSGKIICSNCNGFSGWLKEALNKTLEPEQKVHLICQSCSERITTLIGEKEEKHNKMKVSEVNKGYAGIKKYKTPKVVKKSTSSTPQLW